MAWGDGIWGVGVWGADGENGFGPSIDISIDEVDTDPISQRIEVQYKYNYLVTLSRLTGAPLSLNRTDATLGQELEHESASNIIPLRSRDFLESITLDEISPLNDGNQIVLEMPYGDNRHYTHFTVYRTTNILSDDADFKTVENKYLYVDDVPLTKLGFATNFTPEENNNTALVSFDSKTMSIEDVGSTIKIEDYSLEFELIEYIGRSGDSVTFRVSSDITPINFPISFWYVLGGQNTVQGLRSTADNGDVVFTATSKTRDFSSMDIGIQIFWADGRMSFVKKVLSPSKIVLEEPDGVPEDFNNNGLFVASIDPFTRVFNDTIPDETLESYERRGDPSYFLQSRFFTPLPDGGFGAVKGGAYFVSSLRDSEYYYSQVRDFYRTGSYHPTIQINTKPIGTITRLKEYPDVLCIFGRNFTFYLDTTVEYNGGEPSLGEFIVAYSDPKLITNRVGCSSEGCSADIDSGGELIYTNEPAVRYFDGFKYSDNIALNAIQDTKISELNIQVNMGWDKKRGLYMWGIND